MRRIEYFDYHTHAVEHGIEKPARVEEMIFAAIASDLSAICLTDHFPLPPGFVDPVPEQDCAMSETEYRIYQTQIVDNAKKYGEQIALFRGAEVDYLPEYEEWTRSELSGWNFDYILGSVHFIGNNGTKNLILDYDKKGFEECVSYYGGIENLVGTYYARVRQLVGSGLFDAVGHIDLVKKYNQDGVYFSGNEPWYQNEVRETLDLIAEKNMTIELNTSGWDKPCQEQYPSLWILQEANKRNIGLTTSSDAHTPGNVGRNIDRARNLAKQAGYRSLVRFEKRQKKEVSL